MSIDGRPAAAPRCSTLLSTLSSEPRRQGVSSRAARLPAPPCLSPPSAPTSQGAGGAIFPSCERSAHSRRRRRRLILKPSRSSSSSTPSGVLTIPSSVSQLLAHAEHREQHAPVACLLRVTAPSPVLSRLHNHAARRRQTQIHDLVIVSKEHALRDPR
ncbi:hypothetical protein BDZ90DRAFT_177449 [Jaminaea rosea]|uniref:Uncharacterized protein n=1 Tax=Jaminaea rosea TaxID=1569628 RepID=A0A316UWA9_9BASI|nr:hypothetical protein BDZ90DRAFT_177449 [Jaminaea rosea]PWN27405.1 hypothetical protein BDZ90DRAFT_177449 [Jaminaea rosea]